ncbi:MAG: hypothetical protein LBL90_04850 [Prevotellaceae bacterium]|nr:hypothetical protein [Prevotellaceae bacterium]
MTRNRKRNKITYVKNVVDNKLSTTFSELQSLSFIPNTEDIINSCPQHSGQ